MEATLKRTLKGLKENESTISMFLGGLVVIVVGVLLYNYFRSPTPQVSDEGAATEAAEYTLEVREEENGDQVPAGLPVKHTVQQGEHLWAIAEKYYGSGYNWVDIAKVNRLADANQLNAGFELTIPQLRVRVPVDGDGITAEVVEPDKVTSISADTYMVQKGDNLWTISVRSYGDGYQWTRIFQANQDLIEEPGMIEAGWKIVIPRDS